MHNLPETDPLVVIVCVVYFVVAFDEYELIHISVLSLIDSACLNLIIYSTTTNIKAADCSTL